MYLGERLVYDIEFIYVLMFVKVDMILQRRVFCCYISFGCFLIVIVVNILVEKVKVSCFLMKYIVCVDF